MRRMARTVLLSTIASVVSLPRWPPIFRREWSRPRRSPKYRRFRGRGSISGVSSGGSERTPNTPPGPSAWDAFRRLVRIRQEWPDLRNSGGYNYQVGSWCWASKATSRLDGWQDTVHRDHR